MKNESDDFPILNINKDLIYLDNGATTLKPKVLLESTNDYYSKYTVMLIVGL